VLNSTAKVHALIGPLARLEEGEVLWAMPVDSGLRLLTPGPEVVMRGNAGSCEVEVGRCFRLALMVGASGLIVAHNHTNGRVEPSLADRVFTARLEEAGDLLDCPLFDHVIVGAGKHYSCKTVKRRR
jgi:DNA repair protein RadC